MENENEDFLKYKTYSIKKNTFNKKTKKKISAIMITSVFGNLANMRILAKECKSKNIKLIEDAAEALGSYYSGENIHSGTIGDYGTLSFNVNKIITTGAGGAILYRNNSEKIKIKRLIAQGKIDNLLFKHKFLGYNYGMSNTNAAIGCAQLESLSSFIKNKKKLYDIYCESLPLIGYAVVPIPKNLNWNYWMISIELENKREKDLFLKETNKNGIMTRPIWDLLFKLPMYEDCQRDGQKNALALEDKIINIPSSARG